MSWLEDLIREVSAENGGATWGACNFDPNEVLDYLEGLKEQ